MASRYSEWPISRSRANWQFGTWSIILVIGPPLSLFGDITSVFTLIVRMVSTEFFLCFAESSPVVVSCTLQNEMSKLSHSTRWSAYYIFIIFPIRNFDLVPIDVLFWSIPIISRIIHKYKNDILPFPIIFKGLGPIAKGKAIPPPPQSSCWVALYPPTSIIVYIVHASVKPLLFWFGFGLFLVNQMKIYSLYGLCLFQIQ